MIVGTAGHIDHGKTTLVRALTGVDTDRLPEERRRGISIELGYAFLDLPSSGGGSAGRIGFVDVPGHEKLVHTMLAGATGIDFALLLVAADDGPMPQTHEHLAVLSLLGIGRGAVVVTKADRVDDARLQAVLAEAQALLQGTPLQGAPVLPVSATSGRGVDALRRLLFDAAVGMPTQVDADAAFRLAIDRAFTLAGVGTVVTGTVHAGRVAVGDALSLLGGPVLQPVRVRSLHAQNRAVEQAHAGQRCALALAGVDRAAVERGHWLVTPGAELLTERLDAELQLWRDEAQPPRNGQPVQLHLGAAGVPATLARLDDDGTPWPPGGTARVQLVLRRPLGAWHGERVVLRDAQGTRTLAGGRVLDPLAPARWRRTAQRRAELDAQSAPTLAQRLHGVLAAAPQGVALARYAAAQGLASATPLRALLPPDALRSDAHGPAEAEPWALGAAQAASAQATVLQALAAYHQAHPDERGPEAARLRRLALPRLPEPLWRALLACLQASAAVALHGPYVHLPAHALKLSAADQRLARQLLPRLAAGGFEGVWARDLAQALAREGGEPEPLVRTAIARLSQCGELHQVVRDLVYDPATLARLAALARQVAAAHDGAVTAATFRDATGLGRKRAIQILEYFDRLGLLRRVGDIHRLRQESELFR